MEIDIVRLSGTPREMGERHGELLADGARAMCDARIQLCIDAGMARENLMALAAESLPVFAEWAPDVYAEFQGIAAGARISDEELLVGNGYTDVIDLVNREMGGPSECTAFLTGSGFIGQTWDMNATAYPHVVAFERRPEGAPASVTMTTSGCLSLVGINECGIAIGNTNLVPHDAKPGVMYLAMIHKVLAQTTFDDAVRTITDAPRMSGHFYYIGGPDGEAVGIETTGERHSVINLNEAGVLAHANHYDDETLSAYIDQGELTGNSPTRAARMRELLGEADGHDWGSLEAILSDHGAPICRHELPGSDVRTCSAAIMCPRERTIRMVKGYPCEGGLGEIRLT